MIVEPSCACVCRTRESLAAAVLPCWLLSVSLIIGVQTRSALCVREPRGEEDSSGEKKRAHILVFVCTLHIVFDEIDE
ncbi:hypothetical protein NQZ68_019711 [Dissostichus eleginoides]|nr:hypothetical protein NQZ68_019711 [Dissostichus eleginoides]